VRGLQRKDVLDVQMASRAGISHTLIWLESRLIGELLGNIGGHIVGSLGTKSWCSPEDVHGWDTEALFP
jgi:hypothetical protein